MRSSIICAIIWLANAVPILCWSQDSATKAKIDAIYQYIAAKDTTQRIGVMNYTPLANLYYGESKNRFKSEKTIPIDSIFVLIKEGFIYDINIYAGKSQFTNRNAPIGLTGGRFVQKDFLVNVFTEGEYLLLQEVLLPKFDNSYIPEDGSFWLTPTKKTIDLVRSVGVNTVLDLRLYTDALGLLGSESNGLIQTDARFKQTLLRSNVIDKGLFLLQYVKLNVTGSKFDSRKRFVDINSFSRTELLQKSYVNAEASVNIISGWIPRKSLNSYYIDFGGAINAGKLARKTDTVSITTSNWFGEIGLNLKTSSNIGVDISARMMKQSSPQTNFNGQDKIYTFWKMGAEVYWSSLSEKSNKVFGRFNYFSATEESDRKNHFLQVQIGYSILISKPTPKK